MSRKQQGSQRGVAKIKQGLSQERCDKRRRAEMKVEKRRVAHVSRGVTEGQNPG